MCATNILRDFSEETLAGVEVNLRRGHERYTLVIPQVHHRLANGFGLQAGFGAVHADKDRCGLRLIEQF